MTFSPKPMGPKPLVALLLGAVTLTSPIVSCSSPFPKAAWFDEQQPWAIRQLTDRETVSGVLDRRFETGGALFAARELLLSGEPFHSRFESLHFEASAMDDKALLQSAPWYARYNMEASLLASGLGIHLMHGPSLRDYYDRTAEEWTSQPDALAQRYDVIKKRVGLQELPMQNMSPVFLPYDSGDPFYTQAPDLGDPEKSTGPDAATMLWDEDRFEKTFSGRTLGLALLAEVDFASHYFRSSRPQDDGAARPLLGASPTEGFLGALYLEMAASKITTLATHFAYDPITGDLGPFSLDGYDPTERLVFLPSRVRPVFTEVTVLGETALPPKVEIFRPAQDPVKSRLMDQVCLLYGLSAFIKASHPDGSLSRQGVFGATDPVGALFPNRYHGLAGALARTIYRNIVHMHFRKDWNTLVSYALPESKGRILHTEDAAMAVLALGAYLETLSEKDPIYPQALSLLEVQAYYLLDSQRFDGAYPRTVGAKTAFSTQPIVWPLEAHSLSIRAHVEAYRWLKNPEFTLAAQRTYAYMIDALWALDYQIFRTEEVNSHGSKYSLYSPFLYGATLGALRDLAISTCDESYADKVREYVEGLPFTKLLLSELSPTEEQIFAGEDDAPDPDGDGIPFSPRACPPFGAAPVFASKTIVKIP